MNLKTLAQEYSDEDKAHELVEAWRWPAGVICPHCKSKGAYRLTGKGESKNPVPKGTWKCKECRKKFTVRVGTIFEGSHIALSVWLQAFFMMSASKKGIAAHQIHRMLGITYKSAWFLCHRIRHAMGAGPVAEMLKGVVECDETYVGGKPRDSRDVRKKWSAKVPVVALVERGGNVRPKVVANVTQKNLRQFVADNVAKGSIVNTDQSGVYHTILYPIIKWPGGRHDIVNHSKRE